MKRGRGKHGRSDVFLNILKLSVYYANAAYRQRSKELNVVTFLTISSSADESEG